MPKTTSSKVRRPRKLLKLPERLCHFTTLPGLLGIVSHKQIWASNVSFLNDKKELKHGIDAAAKVLTQYIRKGRRAKLIEQIADELKSTSLPDTYVSCFCTENDILSQWRGYGGREQGISISFDGAALREALRPHRVRPMKVIYDSTLTVSRIRRHIDAIMDAEDDELLGPQTDSEIRQNVIEAIGRLAPNFKDSGFQEEQEWRFVIQKKDLDGVEFREKAGVIIPYLPLSVSEDVLPIKEITIGPGNHREMVARGVETLLTAKGYKNVDVSYSDVPYRS